MLFLKNSVSYVSDLFLRFEANQKRRAPVIYTLLSSVCFSLVSICVKFSLTIPPYQSIYYRAIFILLVNSCIILGGNFEIFTKSRRTNNLLLTRGLIAGVALSLFFHALYLLPLSYFSVLQRLTPIYIGIMGTIFFKEPYKLLHFCMTVTCLIGILLIVKPSFLFEHDERTSKESNTLLIGFVVLSLNNIGAAAIFLTMKQFKNRTTVVIIVFYSNLVNMIVSGVGQIYENPKILTQHELLMILLSGIFSWAGQLMRSRALLLEKALLISILTYTQIVLSYLADYFILDAKIDLWGNFGILIVMVSMLYLLYKEGINV